MTVSILVPFRGDGGQRDRLWAHCHQLFQAMPFELIIGEDPGTEPFNIARAFNRAAAEATGDKFILYGADQIPDRDRIDWAITQLDSVPWCALYANTAGFSFTSTNAILAGALPDSVPLGQSVPFCTAIIGIRADKWVPLDERFHGWGGEDTAWRMVLTALYGDSPEPSGTLRCLYHEAAPRTHADHNFALIGEYMTAVQNGTIKELVDNARSQLSSVR